MAQRGPDQTRSQSRLSRQILGQIGYGQESTNAKGMVDISQLQSGQNGYRPDLEGFTNNASYIKKNLLAVLVQAPRGFQHLPNPELWVGTLKALIELHPQSIEGIQSTLEVEYSQTPVGGAGEQQEDVANVTRSRTVPSFTFVEKYGKPINAFLSGWITNLLMDPETKVPNVMTRAGEKPTDLLPDYGSATVLFIEPDPTQTRVVHAWLSTNVMPKTAGEVTARRDLTAAGETTTYTIEFTSMTQEGYGVNLFAQRYLDEMNMSAVNPNLKPAFVDQIEADVRGAESGYQDQLDRASQTEVQTTDPNASSALDTQYRSVAGDSKSNAPDPNLGYQGTHYRTNGE